MFITRTIKTKNVFKEHDINRKDIKPTICGPWKWNCLQPWLRSWWETIKVFKFTFIVHYTVDTPHHLSSQNNFIIRDMKWCLFYRLFSELDILCPVLIPYTVSCLWITWGVIVKRRLCYLHICWSWFYNKTKGVPILAGERII